MKKEKLLWTRMRSRLSAIFWLERVENAVAEGRPDVDVMEFGVTIPVELKAIRDFPARPSTPVLGDRRGLRRSQKNWLFNWTAKGGRGFILVEIGDRLFAVPGDRAEKVNSFILSDFQPWETDWEGEKPAS